MLHAKAVTASIKLKTLPVHVRLTWSMEYMIWGKRCSIDISWRCRAKYSAEFTVGNTRIGNGSSMALGYTLLLATNRSRRKISTAFDRMWVFAEGCCPNMTQLWDT